jgi:pimeloyl-ACP methyl ester carboxylesterase
MRITSNLSTLARMRSCTVRSLLFALGMTLAGCTLLPGDQVVNTVDGSFEISEQPGTKPTVVFENGIFDRKETWMKVFPDVAATHSVFAYERPGIGRSTSTRRPRDGATIVDDLRTLLRSQGLSPPYILVGHSLGGLYMQLFARRYPSEVAGLVLVDPTHPTQFKGAGALRNRSMFGSTIIALAGLVGPARAEFEALNETGREVLAAPDVPANIPIIILTAPDKSGTAIAAFDNAKRRDFARLYPNATIRENESVHNIQLDHPRAVIDAIHAMAALTRPTSSKI